MGFSYRSEKLVDELRRYAERYEEGSTLGRAIEGTEDLMHEAADLIESLQESIHELVDVTERCSVLCDSIRYALFSSNFGRKLERRISLRVVATGYFLPKFYGSLWRFAYRLFKLLGKSMNGVCR